MGERGRQGIKFQILGYLFFFQNEREVFKVGLNLFLGKIYEELKEFFRLRLRGDIVYSRGFSIGDWVVSFGSFI